MYEVQELVFLCGNIPAYPETPSRRSYTQFRIFTAHKHSLLYYHSRGDMNSAKLASGASGYYKSHLRLSIP